MINPLLAQEYFLGKSVIPGEKILVIRRRSQLERYTSYLSDVNFFGNVWHGLSGIYRGETVIILAGGIGPSQVGDAVYALKKPHAITLFSGTCGSLTPELPIGDYLVVDEAIDGSGYGLSFGKAAFCREKSDRKIFSRLQKALNGLPLCSQSGNVFSTGSVVRETEEDFWLRVAEDNKAIEMECAAFLLASTRSQKKAGALLWVTDLPKHRKSFFDTLSNEDQAKKQTCYDNMVEVNLAVLSQL